MTQYSSAPQRGFSLLEALVVVGVLMVLIGFSVLGWQSTWQGSKANSAMYHVIGQLRTARQTAISNRRNMEVAFTNPNQVQLTPETTTGTAVLPSPYPAVTLDGGSQYALFAGLPDTPMGFGNNSAISFSVPGGALVPPMRFTTSGAFVDANNSLVNGTLFLGLPGKTNTARAVTVLGATGRVRSYYWDGKQWNE